MHEFFKKDWGYKIAAIFLAFLMWFYVTNMQNPATEKMLKIPLTYLNLAEGLVAADKPETVDIRVKGTQSSITTLNTQDIRATVDLSQAELGEKSFSINLTLPNGIELVQINQGQNLLLQIDAVAMKQLEIEVKTENTVAPGYSSYAPEISPSRVVVRGAQKVLESLDKAQITIDLNLATENLVLNSPVILLDNEGKNVSAGYLEISPQTVQVTVPVIQNVPTKTVPIKVALVGQPKTEWQVYRVALEPETVKITGSYERLNNIDHVMTQPVDISGLQQDLIIQVGLISPEGVSMVYEPAVKVIVQLQEAPVTKTFEDIEIEVLNQPADFEVKLKPEKVKLTIQGSQEDMKDINGKIRAVLDLKDKQAGTHQIELKVEAPAEYHVTKVEPVKVEVVISKKT